MDVICTRLMQRFECGSEMLMCSQGELPPVDFAGLAPVPCLPLPFLLLGKAPAEPPAKAVVLPGAAFDDTCRCGFLGVLAREYRGGGVSARSDRIVLGKDPETPVRRASQEKYAAKYAKQKGPTIV